MVSADPRFIADAMLGRLARWLRLLGFDTLYYPDISDRDLLKLSMQEGRLILTRDTHFVRMKNLRNLFFVHANNPIQQLREVIAVYTIRQFKPGRCAHCNGMLHRVDEKASVVNAVPEYVFLHCSSFERCSVCGRVYWEGTHVKRFRMMLGNIVDEKVEAHENA
jgi:uncharacterized protein with PIN domain